METRTMKRVLMCAFAFGFVALLASTSPQPVVGGDDVPADRVVVMYFHRTQRCPTCLKMGSYTEEAVKGEFAEPIKDATVEFHYIDFENQKNQTLTKGYKVGGPTLIVARVAKNKVAEYKNLTEIWSKVADKAAFVKYVQGNVNAYRRQSAAN
jgi:hypothetical protein